MERQASFTLTGTVHHLERRERQSVSKRRRVERRPYTNYEQEYEELRELQRKVTWFTAARG